MELIARSNDKGSEDDESLSLIKDHDVSRLAYQPDKIYKNEWISWEDWLGIQDQH